MIETARGGLRFSHAMVREALYTGVNPARRRIWHRRVAEFLAERSIADPDLVAHHFHQAGDTRATEWLIRAGERAERSYAWQVASIDMMRRLSRSGQTGSNVDCVLSSWFGWPILTDTQAPSVPFPTRSKPPN